VSTTHIAVGAVMGVGLARGIGALDLRVIGGIILSWFITVPVGAILAAIIFYILRAIFIVSLES
jgi:PiT family inorganic phosphate transporter